MVSASVLLGLLALVQIGLAAQPMDGGEDVLQARGARPDAVLALAGGPVVAWARSEPYGGSHRNICQVSPLSDPDADHGDAPVASRTYFADVEELASCCVDRMALARSKAAQFLVVTGCSGREETWLWAQSGSRAGGPAGLPAPIAPSPSFDQKAPRLAAAAGGGFWLTWVENEHQRQGGGTVRLLRLDGTGNPTLGPFELSNPTQSLATASPLGDAIEIRPLPDGGAVVGWLATAGSGDREFRFRIVDGHGRPRTPEIVATPDDHEAQGSIRIEVVRTDTLALVWQRRGTGAASPDAADRAFLRLFSLDGEASSEALPVAVDEPARSQILTRLATLGSERVLIWYETPAGVATSEKGWIAVRRWSPEAGPIGLTTRFPAALAWRWPVLEAIPDEAEGTLILYWHPNGPAGFADPGRIAWRRVVVPDAGLPTAGSSTPGGGGAGQGSRAGGSADRPPGRARVDDR